VQATGDYTDIPWFVNGDLLLGRAEVQTDSFRGEARNHYCLGRPAASQRQAVRLTGKTTSQVTAGARRRLSLKKTDIITIISFNSIFTQKNQKS
jgi:hypothetical protein